MSHVYTVLILIYLGLINQSVAQEPVSFNYNTSSGLPSNNVYSIIQDHLGYIWLSTDLGVCRYDGYSFVKYTTEDGLADNEIFEIYEDKQHRLWFLSYSGNLSFYLNGKIYNRQNTPALARINSNSLFESVTEDDTRIWFSTFLNGVYAITVDLSKVEHYPDLYMPLLFKGGNYSYGLNKNGLYDLQNGTHDSSVKIPVSSNSKIGYQDHEVYAAERGEIFCLNSSTLKTSKISEQYGIGTIQFIKPLKDELYIGGTLGAIVLDRISYKTTSILLRNNSVTGILKDKEGSLWVATLNNGIYFIPDKSFIRIAEEEGLANNVVNHISGLNNQNVIVGHAGSKLTIIRNNRKSIIIPDSTMYQVGGVINFIKRHPYDSNSFIIGGTHTYFYSFRTGNYSKVGTYSSVYEPLDDGRIIIGSRYGLLINRTSTFDFRDKENKEVYFRNKKVVSIEKYNDSCYYLGGVGITAFNASLVEIPFKHKSHFSNTTIADIHRSSDGFIWVATGSRGVFVFNKDTIFAITDGYTGLSSKFTKRIYEDSNHAIWIGTKNGLNKISYSFNGSVLKYNIKRFYNGNGLSSNDINDIFVCNDTAWIATSNGITMFNINTQTAFFKPQLYLTKIMGNDTLELSLGENTFPNTTNNISFHMSCLSFRSFGNITYHYRLIGLSDSWQVSARNEVNYYSLKYGDYLLEMYAKNEDLNLETDMVRYKFSIEPAFWQTGFFRGLVFVSLALLISILFYARYSSIKGKLLVKNKLLEYEKDLLELEQKALMLQMNPHFIFNSINSIQHYIIKRDHDNAYEYLGKFSLLIRKTLNYSFQKTITLEEELETLKLYIEMESLRYTGEFSFKLNIDPEVDLSMVAIPPLLIQPFVENAIWHGLIPKKGPKVLTVDVQKREGEILCVITDNGIGINNSVAKSRDAIKNPPLGLKITSARISAINKVLGNRYFQETIDLQEENMEMTGTKVVLKIKV